MDEVRRAVDRVDDEGRGRCYLYPWFVRLLADEVEGGVGFGEAGGYEGFDCFVGFGYDVCGCTEVGGLVNLCYDL